jgi:hypothetical protein
MKALPLIACAGALALAACATTDDGPELAGSCNADPGQSFVGQRATADAGTALLEATGAKQLRWGPPRSAMTMDFRPDRLTVSYDDAMTIDRVACG